MRRFSSIAAGALFAGFVGGLTNFAAVASAAAAVHAQSAKFAISNMTCATCPITVKKAMSGVAGVRSVEVSFADKTATVVFDSTRTSPAQIAAASTNVGFPAKPAH
ncbi:MAG: heavy-metal-associated domain-containing protein [Sphingomicrobium sp.]